MTTLTIDKIDFSNIERRLRKQWSTARVTQAVEEYRKFLMMVRCKIRVSPCPDVDVVWHEHILHTRQYASDCEEALGEFLHHTPSTGNEEEAELRSETYQATLASYRILFCREPPIIWSQCPPSIVARKKRAVSEPNDGCDC